MRVKCVDMGHRYEIAHLDGDGTTVLQFVKRFRGTDNRSGIICQDLLEVIINRLQMLDNEVPHRNNADILQHLRMAFILFEARALERKVEKEQLRPETLARSSDDGHIIYT